MKPLCPDCGDRHDSHQAHVWNEVKNKPELATAWITPVANAKKRSYRYRDPEARKKYMRELMRKRRQK